MRRMLTGICIFTVLASANLSVAEPAATALTPPAAAPSPIAGKESTAVQTTAKRFHVGYVDTMQVAEQSAVGKAAKADFEAKAARHKSQIDAKQKLLEKQKATLETKLPTYTPEQRAAKIKDYEKKVEDFRKMLQKADKELKPMQEELTREVYSKIEKAAREYATANGFDIIVEKRELLYLGSNVDTEDVSDALVKELNR
jgi:outer membrane protein